MVVPMPGVGAGERQATTPPELLRFKTSLYFIAAGYATVLMVVVLARNMGNALSWLFLLAMSFTMARNDDQCLGHCIVPYTMFSFMTMFLDLFTILGILSADMPAPEHFFALTCKYNDTVILPNDTRVITNENIEWTVPKDTQVLVPRDPCDWQWVVANSAAVVVLLIDVLSSGLGWRMLSTLTSLAPGEDALGGGAANPFMGLGMPRGGLGGRPGNVGDPGTGGGQQEMVGMRQPGVSRPGAGGNGFQPFQGDGRQLL